MALLIHFFILCIVIAITQEQMTTIKPRQSTKPYDSNTAMENILDELYGTSLKDCLNKTLGNSSNTIRAMQLVAEVVSATDRTNTSLQIPLEILKSCLFTASYDKEVAPYLITAHDILNSPDYSYELNYTIILNELIGINMGGSVAFTANFMFMWSDYRLRWSKSTVMSPWTFPTVLNVLTNKVWYPVLSVSNCQKRWCPISPDNNTKVRIESNGTVDMEFSDMLEASCQLDLINFPFDKQTCIITVRFENLDDGDVAVKLNQLDVGYSEYINECDELRVVKFNHEVATTTGYTFTRATSGAGKWNRQMLLGWNNSVIVTIQTTRVTTFYLTNLIIPLLVVIAITLATVVYPTGSEEKVNTLLTMILALVFFQSVLASVMPKTRDDPLLGKYVMYNMLFAGLDLFFTYATIIAINIGGKGYKLPKWAMHVVDLHRFVFVHCCNLRKPNTSVNEETRTAGVNSESLTTANIPMIDSDDQKVDEQTHSGDKKESETKAKEKEIRAKHWLRFAEMLNFIFNIIYVVVNVIIFVIYMVPLFTAYFKNAQRSNYFRDV